jgi:hypothetical protein
VSDDVEEPFTKVTLGMVYTEVKGLREEVSGELSKIKAQLAAQWVVVSIIIVALGGVAARSFFGG